MDGQLIREILALGDADGIHLADQVGDRGVGGGELLAVALARVQPARRDAVAVSGHAITASAADGRVRVVVDLAAFDYRDLIVEEGDQRSDQPALGLAPLAEEDDVLAGEDGVLHLRYDRPLVADDPGEEFLTSLDLPDKILPHLFLDREDAILALSQVGDSRGMLQWKPLWKVVAPSRFYGAARQAAGFKSASSRTLLPPVGSALLRRGAQLVVDNRREVGQLRRQRSQQPETPGQHHVAVRHGEMGLQSRPIEHRATVPGHR